MVHTSDAGHYVLLKEKRLLARHVPAGVARFPAGFKDPDGHWFGLRATVSVIAYNTKAVALRLRPGQAVTLLVAPADCVALVPDA